MESLLAAIRALELPEPVCEYKFHPKRRWRFDLAWPDRMVAAEVDGGLFVGGRHSRGLGREKDMEKINEAVCLGWTVLSFSPRHIKDGRALDWLMRVISRGRT